MKKVVLWSIILCNFVDAVAQPENEKLEQLKAQLQMIQKRADSMNNTLKNGTAKQPGTRPQVNAPGSTITNLELPKMDTIRINSISKKIFTVAEMQVYLKDLYQLMTKKLPLDIIANANAIEGNVGGDPLKLEAAAFYALIGSKFGEAVLLITKAGIKKTDDVLLLTNAGAILDISGLSDKAIPILRTIAISDPTNGIAANNLGQASR